MNSVLYWIWLADGLGSGYRQAKDLLRQCPDPRTLYEYIARELPLPKALHRTALARLKAIDPAALQPRLEACARLGVQILTPQDIDYPERLRTLPDMPVVLYVTGSIACLNGGRYVGMVGTRRPTRYGQQACHDLALNLARAGVVLVSGLADGLDAEAHRAAVEANTPTVAFLGTGIDKTFPAANADLRYAIEAGGGAVVSEYPLDYQGKTTGTFLARNRLIAGLSEAVCVTEARRRSGTLNTVSHAVRYDRLVFSVPGSIYSPTSEGTNDLLREGRARPLCEASDVLKALEMPAEPAPEPAAPDTEPSLSEDARQVLAALGPVPRTPAQAAADAGLPVPRVLVALMELELAGAAVSHPGQLYTAER